MSQILRTALRELIAEAKHFSILDRAVAKADAVLLAEHKRDPNTCYYCGLHHDRVEAGGVYHCPNNLRHKVNKHRAARPSVVLLEATSTRSRIPQPESLGRVHLLVWRWPR